MVDQRWSEFLAALIMKNVIFWDVTLHSSVKVQERFWRVYCHHLQGQRVCKESIKKQAELCGLPMDHMAHTPEGNTLHAISIHTVLKPVCCSFSKVMNYPMLWNKNCNFHYVNNCQSESLSLQQNCLYSDWTEFNQICPYVLFNKATSTATKRRATLHF
jgi:hypothetical protein